MVVAARLVGAGLVYGGGKGPAGGFRSALAGDGVARPAFGRMAQLADHVGHVVAEPFVVDHVVLDIAVGDAAGGDDLAGGRAEDAVAKVGATCCQLAQACTKAAKPEARPPNARISRV